MLHQAIQRPFLIRVVHRVDRNARRFKRATRFKVYLTNPSMRAALFGPIEADDVDMGHMAETAIFSQWFHDITNVLYYARWARGEIDMVWLDTSQKVDRVMEVKWSDRYYHRRHELKNIIQFCHNNNMKEIFITTRLIFDQIEEKNVSVQFAPTSVFCLLSGEIIIKKREVST